MNETSNSKRCGTGEYIVNREHIIIKTPHAGNIADIQEKAIAAGQVLNGRNIAVYGMAALIDDPSDPKRQHLASHATLVNQGVIEIYIHDMVEAYKEQIQQNPKDTEHLYRFVKIFAMAAGKDSLIVNEGKIIIHFDQGAESDTPVYGETLLCGENSTIINRGEIELLGDGSYNTQARAIAVPADNMTIINDGRICLDMDRCSTIRILATTGNGGSIVNNGRISVKSSGRIMTIARFSNTQLLNTGEVDIVSRARFIINKVSFLYQSYPLACAFYEHELPNATEVPAIVNSGKIHVHLEGTEESTPQAVAFGIYSEMVGMEQKAHRFENTGEIRVTKSGPHDYLVAEVGCNVQAKKNFPYRVAIGEWHTKARDFARTKDLFVCGSGIFDFADTQMVYDNNDKISIDNATLVYQTEEAAQRGDTCTVNNIEKINSTNI